VKTLDDRFDALREELELTLRPNAPGIPESRSAVGRVVVSVALVAVLCAGVTALVRRTGRVAPAVSTASWFEEKSHAMEPTLGQFDKVQVDYSFTTLNRSDLVVAQVPEMSAKPVILRIIGLPGESVLLGGGPVIIDGKQLREDYLNLQAEPPPNTIGARPVVLERDEYFLAADSRATSAAVASAVVKRSEILAQAERGCSAFMNLDATAPQIAAVRSVFETEPAIKSFQYVDKREALEEIKRLFPGSPEMTDLSASDGQGVPTSFRAVMNREIDSGGFEARTKLQPGVSILRCGLPVVDYAVPALVEGPTPTDVTGAFVTAAPATTAAPSSETTTIG
jgi:signal peptidase I